MWMLRWWRMDSIVMALSADAHPVATGDPLPRHPAAGALSLKVPLVGARDECTRSRPASGSVVQDQHHAPLLHREMRPVSGSFGRRFRSSRRALLALRIPAQGSTVEVAG